VLPARAESGAPSRGSLITVDKPRSFIATSLRQSVREPSSPSPLTEILLRSPVGGTSLRLTFIILGTLLSTLYVVGFVLIGWLWKVSSVDRVPSEDSAAAPAAVAVSRRRATEAPAA